MNIAAGLVVAALGLLAWGGQAVSRFFPDQAVAWGLMEAEADVEPTFFADIRAEAWWDSLTLWTMTAAGVLLVVDHRAWPYFGLVSGGMYLYFAGRGIQARRFMMQEGLRIGSPQSVRTGMVFLTIWGVMAAALIAGSAKALS